MRHSELDINEVFDRLVGFLLSVSLVGVDVGQGVVLVLDLLFGFGASCTVPLLTISNATAVLFANSR